MHRSVSTSLATLKQSEQKVQAIYRGGISQKSHKYPTVAWKQLLTLHSFVVIQVFLRVTSVFSKVFSAKLVQLFISSVAE
jgi:hypothetical protein